MVTVSDLIIAQNKLRELDWSHQGQKKHYYKEGYYYSPNLHAWLKKGLPLSEMKEKLREIKKIRRIMNKPKKLSEMSSEEQLNHLIWLHNKLKNEDDFYYAAYMKESIGVISESGSDNNNKENKK